MQTNNIGFIGAGNMARSLIGGLIADGRAPNTIWASDASKDMLSQLHGVHTSQSNTEVAEHADILILAVKPQVLKAVATELRDIVQKKKPLIVSVAAGIREKDINNWLGGNLAIVRVMPNTPALIQTGASALYANQQVNQEQRNSAETILRAVGIALWVNEEKQMDAVTALSGSGPAYFFLFMEAMQAAGKQLGLPEETAHLLTLQTAFGATKMALESNEDCATLRQRVTSPGGTTERALNVFNEEQLKNTVLKAITAATERADELAKQLGD